MPLQSGLVEVNGASLYYEMAGTGHPLVLLHGFGLDLRMWDAQFAVLARDYRVIRYDMRGFGQSTPPTVEIYSHSDDLKALLDNFLIQRAHIMGLSMGGGVAIDFALAYPQAVNRLVLIDSTLGGYQWSKEWDESVIPIWKYGRQGDIASARRLWLEHPLFEAIMANPQYNGQFRQIVEGYSGWHWANKDPGRGLNPPAVGRLNAIQSPALVLIGERDLAGFHEIANLLIATLPNARKVNVSGVGHMLSMESPETVNEAVLDFLGEAASS